MLTDGHAAGFWAQTEPAWRESFLLAWQSFRAGSVPVGAVLVDSHGTIVSRGRNRRNETDFPAGQLGGSNLAHAEVNALATLVPGRYHDHVLYSTLEPCLLCTGALRYSHVGLVRFAAPDPMWYGVERLPDLNPHLARNWTRREGPVGGPLQAFSLLLNLVSAVERDSRPVIECHEQATPDALRLARRVAGEPAAELRAKTVTEALDALWPDLLEN